MSVTNSMKHYSVPNQGVTLSNIGNQTNASLLKLGDSQNFMNSVKFYQGVTNKSQLNKGAETAQLLGNISAGVGIASSLAGAVNAFKDMVGGFGGGGTGTEATAKAGTKEVAKAIAEYTKTGDIKSLQAAVAKEGDCKAQAVQIEAMDDIPQQNVERLTTEKTTLKGQKATAEGTLSGLQTAENTAKGSYESAQQAYEAAPAEPAAAKASLKTVADGAKKTYEEAKKAREKQEGVVSDLNKQVSANDRELTKANKTLATTLKNQTKARAANTAWGAAIDQAKNLLGTVAPKEVKENDKTEKTIDDLKKEAVTLGVKVEVGDTKESLQKKIDEAKGKNLPPNSKPVIAPNNNSSHRDHRAEK